MTGAWISRAALTVALGAGIWSGPASAATEEQLREAFAVADRNADGVVDVDEYVAYFVEAFRARDADGRGYLTIDELRDVDPARFAAADRNGDGRISLGETVAERMIVFFDLASDDGVIRLEELLAYEAAR